MEHKWEKVFGERVKDLRKARGWTQDKLALQLKAAGFPAKQTTIAKIESGARPTSVGEIATIAAVLDTPIGELFDRADDPAPQLRLAISDNKVKSIGDERDRVRKQLASLEAEYEAAVAAHRDLVATLGGEGILTATAHEKRAD